MALKLGKLVPKHDPRTLSFTQFQVAATLKAAPIGFGHQGLIPSWGMLGNDRAGDCVVAGGAHETMLWNAIAKRTIPFDAKSVLSDYSTVTGYDPVTGANDNGTVVLDYLKYRRNTGALDAVGQRHHIGAFVALEVGNWTQLLEALYIFDVVGIGVEFPNTAMTQFENGQPWSVVPGAQIEGGHYIPIVGRPKISTLNIVTWGKVQPMTRAFYKKYCDEAWGILSTESLANGKTAEGFDLTALQSAIATF
jgi:hypothetical protein